MPTATTAKPKTAKTTAKTRTAKPGATKAKAADSSTARATARQSSSRRRDREGIDRGVETADEVLDQIRQGGQNAVDAVRRFVGRVDESLVGGDETSPSRGHDLVDSALDMTDRLIESGSDAIRGIVRSAGRSFGTGTGSQR
ncbi:MAG: hypothetical protein HY827_07340 [Actinobacteria bacterium]|nr:hypothetical protein [Actinomycetota bacterium]